ncbi:MAG: L,D-transpeptidase family protein [Flavobacterium sp.]|nr:L,D-transpeptidase family protein [Flavobacterium sp.]
MKKLAFAIVIILTSFSIATVYGNTKTSDASNFMAPDQVLRQTMAGKKLMPIDKTILANFFKKHPYLKTYQLEVNSLYKKRNYTWIWHDKEGLIEFADLLYSKANRLEEEGLKSSLPYKDKIDGIFDGESKNKLSKTDTELLLSSMYVYYVQKVYQGIDSKKTTEIGWFIPRKNLSYTNLLDSLLVDASLLDKNANHLLGQYYKLREKLKEYRQIEKNGGWDSIKMEPSIRDYKPDDTSKVIGQIRKRLAITGDLKQDSKSNCYDEELMAGVLDYKRRNGFKLNYHIDSDHVENMNISVGERIKTIMVNMERCRWIDPELAKADEFIVINIPSFKLFYIKNGVRELESKVFVGKNMTETVIFSGNINQIVFSPYWNVPKSIIDNELKFAMDQDKNYLASNNMEWNNGNVRQKPGPKNSLGLVKFMFPNSNSIYLHDTPVKSLFDVETRAFSHGCINMEKAKELAVLILKDDPNWPIERINVAMNGEKETSYFLKKPIPVHISYFTASVDDSGIINFYRDIYQRDHRLAELLFTDDFK